GFDFEAGPAPAAGGEVPREQIDADGHAGAQAEAAARGSRSSASARSASASRPKIWRAYPASTLPASVGTTPRASRSSSAAPSVPSSSRICFESAGWLRRKRAAAALMLPAEAAAANRRRWFRFMLLL